MGSTESKHKHHNNSQTKQSVGDGATTTTTTTTTNNNFNNTPMPNIDFKSTLLNEEEIKKLLRYLPDITYRDEWKLLFSSSRDGHSFNRFITHCSDQGSLLVIIKEEGEEGHVFGGFLDENLKPKYPKFYGNKNNFLFKIKPKFEVFQTTGLDQAFQYLNSGSQTLFNGFAMGGELLYGFSIDSTFDHGESKGSDEILSNGDGLKRSSTYGNTCMCSQEEYKIEFVEVYQLKPLQLSEEEILNIEFANRKKVKGFVKPTVLSDENNADKAIKGMMGHEFTHYHEDLLENPEKPKNTTPLHP